jgi:Family of unknown function (DUF6090)
MSPSPLKRRLAGRRPQLAGWWAWLTGLDLKYAFRELFLIVTGILIAVTINNWNDGRKQRANEVKMLRELRASLQNDLRDIEVNLIGLRIMLQRKKAILESEKTGYHDSLHSHLNGLLYDNFYLVVNRASFESLKSVGLYLISNDSLRLKISNLYEYDYKIHENYERTRDDYSFQKAKEFARDVMLLHETEEGRAERYANLFRNTDFKVFAYESFNFDQFKESQNSHFKKVIERLIAEIEAEIKRLE